MASAAEILERQRLVEDLYATEEARKEWLRKAILEYNRVDLLCTEILGLQLKPFHKALQIHCLRNKQSLQLAFRGGGKSTTLTVALTIFTILKNRDVRILITSKTHQFAKNILKEIKGHLEGNETLIEIFGDLIGPTWGSSEIIVKGRSKVFKEPTITTIGAEGQVIGMHYDMIWCDDLIDEKNARTKYMREQVKVFFYKTLLPTLEPGGELHVVGTRYHYADLYGHLMENEMEHTTQIVPVLNEKGQTPWPEKFSPEEAMRRRKAMGLVIFNTQMQCDADGMKGEIFQIDYMPEVSRKTIPADAKVFLGVDLSTGEGADYFAIVAVAISGAHVWVLDHYQGMLRYSAQAKKIADWWDRFSPVKCGIETNAYQAVIAQTLEENSPHVLVKKIHTSKDKVSRAIKLSARHEEGNVFYVFGNQPLISHLVLFPKADNDDMFDALDHAIFTGLGKRRRKRKTDRRAVGLL